MVGDTFECSFIEAIFHKNKIIHTAERILLDLNLVYQTAKKGDTFKCPLIEAI